MREIAETQRTRGGRAEGKEGTALNGAKLATFSKAAALSRRYREGNRRDAEDAQRGKRGQPAMART